MAHRRTQEASAETSDPERTSGGGGGSLPLPRRRYLQFGVGTLATLVGAAGRAASRSSPKPRSDRTERYLLIRGGETISRYELTVDGELEPGAGASEDATARISGRSAEGVVRNENRRYRFSGDIRDVAVDGDAGIYVATDRIDPSNGDIEHLRRDVPDFEGRPR
ncbi:MAG: hypothetical protein ACQET5_01420 [Halobacteriota archaeon]|uniref:hypothetical protein n=1 Tax=Natronomonas sp. TaxID=2184060 RepID=UPI003975451E